MEYNNGNKKKVEVDSEKLIKLGMQSGLNIDNVITSAILNLLYENHDNLLINEALEIICKHFNAERCYIAQTFDKGMTYSCTYEWCENNVTSYKNVNQNVLATSVNQFLTLTQANGIYVCKDMNDCNIQDEIPSIILGKGTKSFIHSQVKRENKIAFFITVEDYKSSRDWTYSQVCTIEYLSKIIFTVIQSNNMFSEIKRLNEYNKVSAFVADNTDNFIYIVDPDNYDILHMNQKALNMYNHPKESVWKNKKCYDLLHGKTQPCEFCTNKMTREDVFFEWQYYNPKFNKTYLFKDKLVQLNNKLVKLQIATDITTLVKLEAELKDKLDEQTLLLDCIKMLHSTQAPDKSIEKILGTICKYFEADRSMVLQILQDGNVVSNTHEWAKEGIQFRKHLLQNLSIDVFMPFFDKFGKNKVSYIENVMESFNNNKQLKKLMSDQNLSNIICAPILDSRGDFIGMFSVENPTKNVEKYWLIESLSGFVSDFLEKNKFVESLNKLSYYDTLTGIKNRHSYRKELKEIDETNISSLGVAYVDITGLSRINEEKGTRFGDEIVKQIARMLTEVFAENVFRVDGDEFVVLERNVKEIVFEQKISLLKNEISKKDGLSASIGYTWNTNFNVKQEDKSDNYITVRDSKRYTAMLSKNLEHEIKSGKFEVFLQPQINFKSNKLDGAEALIRRIDASGNVQSPASFVPFYEKEGMISQIDIFVFRKMCELIKGWDKKGIALNIKFSVNLSRSTVMEKDIINKLNNICQEYNINKSRIILEITETISHSSDKVFANIIATIKQAGFSVSLDDFGSGHANLTSLRASDFDEIKIDMGLTKDVHNNEKARILTKVALNLCEELDNMVSVAEGIETLEQFNTLKSLNCEKGQGYYFSKPITIKEFESKYFY